MGTETHDQQRLYLYRLRLCIKLNNPLMGTETI